MIANIFNLGPIEKASIDLRKPFTLFCGTNNTGKTYLSYILYALHRDIGHIDNKDIESLARRLFKDKEITLCKDDVERYIYYIPIQIKSGLGNIFGIGNDRAEKLFKDFEMQLSLSKNEYEEIIKKPFNLSIIQEDNVVSIDKEKASNKISYKTRGEEKENNKEIISDLKFLLERLIRDLCLGKFGGASMLTVERNSIYTFKTELSIRRSELIESIQQQTKGKEIDVMDLINRNSRRYPSGIRDSLRIANDIENVQKIISPFRDLAEQIEEGVLNGKVKITPNGDVEFIANNMDQSEQLPIHLTSSIVKTMSSLIIYLKHIARKGDLLIIDEPEMNFHPDVQIFLMRVFSIMTKRGLRLIVSTHSDYMVREVNNLIMAHTIYSKDSKLIESFKYTQDMLLDKKNVAVKYFCYKPGSKSVEVEDIPIDDAGFAIESMDNAINSQNEITETFFDRLEEDAVYDGI